MKPRNILRVYDDGKSIVIENLPRSMDISIVGATPIQDIELKPDEIEHHKTMANDDGMIFDLAKRKFTKSKTSDTIINEGKR